MYVMVVVVLVVVVIVVVALEAYTFCIDQIKRRMLVLLVAGMLWIMFEVFQ